MFQVLEDKSQVGGERCDVHCINRSESYKRGHMGEEMYHIVQDTYKPIRTLSPCAHVGEQWVMCGVTKRRVE